MPRKKPPKPPAEPALPKSPTKPTQALVERVRDRILNGARLEAALAAEGVTDDVRRTWAHLAQLLPGGPASRFFVALRRAFAAAECELVAELRHMGRTPDFDSKAFVATLRELVEQRVDGEVAAARIERMLMADPKVAAARVKALTWILERTRRENFGAVLSIKVEEAKEELLDRAQRALERFPGAFDALLAALGPDDSEVGREERPEPTGLTH